MEVRATKALEQVPVEKRKCRFSHEVEGKVQMFEEYSQVPETLVSQIWKVMFEPTCRLLVNLSVC